MMQGRRLGAVVPMLRDNLRIELRRRTTSSGQRIRWEPRDAEDYGRRATITLMVGTPRE